MKENVEKGSTIDRFRRFLKTILSVSKGELDEALQAEKNVTEPDAEPDAD